MQTPAFGGMGIGRHNVPLRKRTVDLDRGSDFNWNRKRFGDFEEESISFGVN